MSCSAREREGEREDSRRHMAGTQQPRKASSEALFGSASLLYRRMDTGKCSAERALIMSDRSEICAAAGTAASSSSCGGTVEVTGESVLCWGSAACVCVCVCVRRKGKSAMGWMSFYWNGSSGGWLEGSEVRPPRLFFLLQEQKARREKSKVPLLGPI